MHCLGNNGSSGSAEHVARYHHHDSSNADAIQAARQLEEKAADHVHVQLRADPAGRLHHSPTAVHTKFQHQKPHFRLLGAAPVGRCRSLYQYHLCLPTGCQNVLRTHFHLSVHQVTRKLAWIILTICLPA